MLHVNIQRITTNLHVTGTFTVMWRHRSLSHREKREELEMTLTLPNPDVSGFPIMWFFFWGGGFFVWEADGVETGLTLKPRLASKSSRSPCLSLARAGIHHFQLQLHSEFLCLGPNHFPENTRPLEIASYPPRSAVSCLSLQVRMNQLRCCTPVSMKLLQENSELE